MASCIDNTGFDLEEMRAKLAEMGSWFQKIVGEGRRKVEWRPLLDVPINALPREARSADLVVVVAPYPGSADLIVTGAYGHSRLGEWAFGGMTRDLLATSPICCLMSH
jgi:nucleotide-binding universal stress UspA family protein